MPRLSTEKMTTMKETTANGEAATVPSRRRAASVDGLRSLPRNSCTNCSTAPAARVSSAMTMTMLPASTPRNWTVLSNHGTPYADTYHQPLMPISENASRKIDAPAKSTWLRREPTAQCEIAMAASAASAAPMPAYTPKWWVHLVGVKVRKNMVPTNMNTRRIDGAARAPGTVRWRSSAATVMASAISAASTAKRRVKEPSTDWRIIQ